MFPTITPCTLSDKILLQGTSYAFINAGRYFFCESQNQGSGVLKNFQAAEGLNGERNYMEIYVDINLWLTFSIKRAQIRLD